MVNFHKISIIIPVFNAEKTIAACVNAVLQQKVSGVELEVIVVDDGSTDTTAEILRTFERVIYVRQPNAGPAAARNRGAVLASGEILFFTDSDCIPRPDWVSRILGCFESEDIHAAAGSYGIANSESCLARCIHREILYRHECLMGDWIEVFGSYNVAVRRDVFQRMGGFDESYRFPSGEDNDLSYRLRETGIKIRFVKDAKVDHAHPVSVKRYLGEQFRHGFWRVKTYREFPAMMKGDGYTFWKDPFEVMLTVALVIAVVISLFYPVLLIAVIGLLLFWLGVEMCFAMMMRLHFPDEVVFFSWVMLLRSWTRTAGFLKGILSRPLDGRC